MVLVLAHTSFQRCTMDKGSSLSVTTLYKGAMASMLRLRPADVLCRQQRAHEAQCVGHQTRVEKAR